MRKSIIFMMMFMVAAAFAGRINITNDTGSYDFWYVHISPSSSDSWGDDWLGETEVIYAGDSRSFSVSNDTYDVMIEDEDGDTYTFWNVRVNGTVNMVVDLGNLGEQTWSSSGSTSAHTGGGMAPITIDNDLGSWTIWYIYGDPSDSPWGNDRLGSELLHPGETMTFYVPANDYYDFKCEDEDGDTYTLWEVWVDEDGFYWSVDLSDMD